MVHGIDADLKVALPLCLNIHNTFARFGPLLISLYSSPSCNYAYQFICPIGFTLWTQLFWICNVSSILYWDDDLKLFDEHMGCPAHSFYLNWSSSSLWYRIIALDAFILLSSEFKRLCMLYSDGTLGGPWPRPNEMVCSCNLIDLQLPSVFQSCFFFVSICDDLIFMCGNICMRYAASWPYTPVPWWLQTCKSEPCMAHVLRVHTTAQLSSFFFPCILYL